MSFDPRKCWWPWLLWGISACNDLLGIESSRQVEALCDAAICAATAREDAATPTSRDAGESGSRAESAGQAAPSPAPDPSRDRCREGAVRCDGAKLQRCNEGEFADQETCPFACRDGACGGECSAPTERCRDGLHEVCTADHTFEQAASCPGECVAEGCAPCEPGVERCAGSAIDRCYDGAYAQVTRCDFDCDTRCGGFPVGRFRVRHSCLNIAEEEVPIADGGACTPRYAGTVQRVQGTVEIGADLRVSGDLSRQLEQEYTIGEMCLDTVLAGLTCADIASALKVDRCVADGTACDCTLSQVENLEPIFGGLASAVAAGEFCAGEDGLRLQIARTGKQNVLDLERIRGDAYLKTESPQANAEFGYEVALGGDVLLVGAPFEDDGAGAAYVLTRDGDLWQPAARLLPAVRAAGDHFGADVAFAGDTFAVSAPDHDGPAPAMQTLDSGAVYVFRRASDGRFAQEAYLRAPRIQASASFGWEIAIDGSRIAVSAPNESSDARGIGGDPGNENRVRSGAVFIFNRAPDNAWTLQAYLKASNADADDQFGASVALHEDWLLVGADGEDGAGRGVDGDREDNGGSDRGAAYAFRYAEGAWKEIAYLKPTEPGFPARFGTAVAIDGRSALVGASWDSLNAAGVDGEPESRDLRNSGAAYVFAIRDGAFEPSAYLKADHPHDGDFFGYRVALLGTIALVSSLGRAEQATHDPDADAGDATPNSPGTVFEFFQGASGWALQRRLQPANPMGDIAFGSGLAISGATIAVGAHLDDSAPGSASVDPLDTGATNAGAVYVYR